MTEQKRPPVSEERVEKVQELANGILLLNAENISFDEQLNAVLNHYEELLAHLEDDVNDGGGDGT